MGNWGEFVSVGSRLAKNAGNVRRSGCVGFLNHIRRSIFMARIQHGAAYSKEGPAEAHPQGLDAVLYFVIAGLFLLIAAFVLSSLSGNEIPGTPGQPALTQGER
jgi:hypothetical protein